MTLADDQAGDATYTVLARRYRPARFEDCVGQQHVAQAIRNAIQTQRVAHAYLFCGSRGVGKTSMARIFAKALNCADGPTPTPCGKCESCLAITAGSDLDVVEIDGASNRGIDEIRELRQGVAYRPSRSRFKVYIIDEVHMLTKEAFNALLKTLEEPPPHVKFVFATTEAHKIPITILSRCQRYDFASIGLEEIGHRLAEIVAAEGMTADPEAIDLVARRARGSMRDSQSLLDQVLAYSGGKLTADTVHQLLGTAGEDRVLALASSILTGDAAESLRLVDQAVHEGVQLGEWIEQMLDYLRDLMVLGIDENAGLISMSNRHRESMIAQARRLSVPRVLEMMDILAACKSRLRGTTLGRTLVEMTLVRLCRLDEFMSLSAALSAPPPSAGATATLPAAPSAAALSMPRPTARPTETEEAKKNGVHEPSRLAPVASHQQVSPAISLSEETVADAWKRAVSRIEDTYLPVILGQVSSVGFDPPRGLIVRFPSSRSILRKQCEEKVALLREACAAVCGGEVTIRFEESAPLPSAATGAAVRSPSQLRQEAARDPLIQQAEDLLEAKMLGDVILMAATAPASAPRDESADDDLASKDVP